MFMSEHLAYMPERLNASRAKAVALGLTIRPLGNTAHRSTVGKCQIGQDGSHRSGFKVPRERPFRGDCEGGVAEHGRAHGFFGADAKRAGDLYSSLRSTLAKAPGLPSAAAVAAAVGYQSEAAFQRAFKHKMGVTSAAWRRTASSQD
jgi:AraC-like DNA-binding protein